MDVFGERLKAERKRLGLKSMELAQIGNVGAVAQSNYERGKRHPDSAYLAAIAAVGVDVQYVLTGQRSAEPVLTPKERLLLAAWNAASPELQTAVLAVLATGQSGVGGVNVGRDNNGNITMVGTMTEANRQKK